MTGQRTPVTVVRTDGVLGGEPRLEGRRISVLQVAERVERHDEPVERVAERLGVRPEEVRDALAYYRDHPAEMEAVRRRHEEIEAELDEVATSPPPSVER